MSKSINSHNSLTCQFAKGIKEAAATVETAKIKPVSTDSNYSVFAALGRISTELEGSKTTLAERMKGDCENLVKVAETYIEGDRLAAIEIMTQI